MRRELVFIVRRCLLTHYYDLNELLGLEEVMRFIDSSDFWDTFEEVKAYGEDAFRNTSGLCREDLRKCSCFFPESNDLVHLQREYDRSRRLYFVDPPSFIDILTRIQGAFRGL